MSFKKYILRFAQEHINFRYPELQSVLSLFNIPHNLPPNFEDEINKPFFIIELPNDELALKLATRCASVRGVIEHWSSSSSCDLFHTQLKDYIATNENSPQFQGLLNASFRVRVETFNKRIQQKEKVERIETLAYLPFEGEVNLKSPDFEYFYVEYYGHNPTNLPTQPEHYYFGKWLGDGLRTQISEISLKTRKFIGNTSMDATLSLLMANQAQVKPGDFVYDPFVGTGSLLVAAAKFGGFVMGTDIDYLTLHGKTKPTRARQKIREEDESILANLKQYNCGSFYLDVVVSDFSNPLWHQSLQLDCIITDPPYGIREAREKIETKVRRPLKQESTVDADHYPSTSPYQLSNLYEDLLRFSAQRLRIGGRLVCWIPIYQQDYSESCIPKSNCFKLIANSEQVLSSIAARRLLTYEKIAEPSGIQFENIENIQNDFRPKFFAENDTERKEKKLNRIELREIGKKEKEKRRINTTENVKPT